MADSLATTGPATVDGRAAASRLADVLRDIARGGIAGGIVGFLVAGLGGRLVMRLAALLHESSVGATTEAGEVIGQISLNGTIALMVFGGLGMGLMAGTIWVIVSPWIPGRRATRALLTAGAAIALGTPPLIQRTNVDFFILDHDPVVVAMLVALVGVVGWSLALVDGFLDDRLPRPTGLASMSSATYLVVALLGLLLIAPIVVTILFTEREYDAPIRAGWALAVVGACTLAWWILRTQGRPEPPAGLRRLGSAALLAAVILGSITGVPHILVAAGVT